MTVAIVRYNAGNTVSVSNALKRLGVDAVVTDSPGELKRADKVIFPGVGEASTAMAYLCERGLENVIKELTQPVLGICLGMQLMCAASEENDTECMDIVPYQVRRFEPSSLKVPHTGWNRITNLRSPLFEGVDEGARVYFVHGYYADLGEQTTSMTEYGVSFSASVQHNNFHAVQFHTEKSGEVGSRILQNFLNL